MIEEFASKLRALLQAICDEEHFIKATLSVPRRANEGMLRTTIHPVFIRDQIVYQFSDQTQTQQIHKNLSPEMAISEMVRLMFDSYRNMNLFAADASYSIHLSRKGSGYIKKLPSNRQTEVNQPVIASPHNRKKNYLIPEDVACPFLIHLGVMTNDGHVRRNYSHKFKQINRFIEFIDDVVRIFPKSKDLRIVDFGCGKSYLTFATHYLLTELLGYQVDLLGLDRRIDVVQTCQRITNELRLSGLRFETADIADFEAGNDVDMVIALHACNQASDDALFKAVAWNAKVILVAPCCHQELRSVMASNALSPITDFGVLADRYASLATDALRAALMTAVGYKTQVLEFIETEHTPKNVLIRCVRDSEAVSTEQQTAAIKQVRQLRDSLGVPPLSLEQMLSQSGRLGGKHSTD